MNPQDFAYLDKILRDGSGLSLTPDKAYLLESRLTPIAREKGLEDVAGLVAELRRTNDREMIRTINDAMTTNESMFFRDTKPFDQFKQVVLPELKNSKPDKRVRIWSAACSNGQEPYSLAMVIKEMGAELAGWNFEIVATDLCRKVLQKAEDGLYSQFEVQRGLPITLLVKYFTQEGNNWRLKPEIKQMVTFKEFNLLDNPATLGKFDIILCRNVLIYFDENTKNEVLRKIRPCFTTGIKGFLFLGSTESAQGVANIFSRIENYAGLYETL